jgi:hypothetical protein
MSAVEVSQLVHAILDFSRWIHRRVEAKSFIDDAQMIHRTSVDFTVPATDLPRSDTDPETCLVPLLFLRKGELRSFDLRDEDGTSLPVLTRQQNGRIAAECLAGLYELACKRANTNLPPDQAIQPERAVIGLLGMVAGSDTDEALAAQRELTVGGRRVPSSHAEAIRSYGPLVALLADFSSGFLLLTHLKARVGDRRVLKISYTQPFRWMVPRRLLPRLVLGMTSWLGWTAQRFYVSASGIGSAQSYHFEMGMPADVLVESAELRRVAPVTTVLDSESFVVLTHLTAAGQSRGAIAWARVRFRLRSSILWPGFIVSSATTVLLTLGVFLREANFHPRLDPASAFIVALPALFGAYSLATEHRLTRRLSVGTRAGSLASVVISLVAAGTMAITSPLQIPELTIPSVVTVGPIDMSTDWRLLTWVTLAAVSFVNFLAAAVPLGVSIRAEQRMWLAGTV